MNHRFLLRLITNIAFCLLSFSCLGIVLWVVDVMLQWDILPDALSMVVEALLVAGGIIAFVLMIMNVLLSLTLIAEANASRANLPNYGVSERLKRQVRKAILASIVAIALLIGGLQITNHLRGQVATREAEAEFIQTQADMDDSMSEVLALFSPPLLEGLENNTLAEKGQLGNMAKLFNAIATSFPHTPVATVLIPANQAPYKYARIDGRSLKSNTNGKITLSPELYTTFPDKREAEAIEQLFAGTLPTLIEPLEGQLLNNTVPSSWGLLKRNDNIIAVVYLAEGYDEPYDNQNYYDYYPSSTEFHHDGPDKLLTN
ncbi:MAG: hypothetical protein AAGC93_21150 [Cyanobacteria bacterium P01_F01_bin.53]